MFFDNVIDCPKCNHDVDISGEIRNSEQWVHGMCVKCGWTLCLDHSMSSLEDVNEQRRWMDCKEVDELYLLTNRLRNVSIKEKILELGYMTEEELEKMIERHNSHIFDQSISWDFGLHKGRIHREYGKLKQSVQNTPKKGPSETTDFKGSDFSDSSVQKGNVL